MKAAWSVAAMVLALNPAAEAQLSGAAPGKLPGQVNRQQPGPWDNDVLVYRAPTNGTPEKLAAFERAGVPTLARLKDGRILAAFQHFPENDNRNFDRVAVRFSSDEGRTWITPEPIVVAGLEPGLARPFDPTLVTLRDGSWLLAVTGPPRPGTAGAVAQTRERNQFAGPLEAQRGDNDEGPALDAAPPRPGFAGDRFNLRPNNSSNRQLSIDQRPPAFDRRGFPQPAERRIFTRIPSSAGGREGLGVGILYPREPRYTNGAPIAINVTGGVQAGSALGRPEYVGLGFIEIHFAFPGGGQGEERSGGRYDFRGPNCVRALADVIRFATRPYC